VNPCCVEERGGNGRWTGCVGGLRASAKALSSRNLRDLKVGSLYHGQDLVTTPIRAGYFALVEGDPFLEGFAETHDGAALHAAFELAWVDDLYGVDTDGVESPIPVEPNSKSA
jgi:hypothetical protein